MGAVSGERPNWHKRLSEAADVFYIPPCKLMWTNFGGNSSETIQVYCNMIESSNQDQGRDLLLPFLSFSSTDPSLTEVESQSLYSCDPLNTPAFSCVSHTHLTDLLLCLFACVHMNAHRSVWTCVCVVLLPRDGMGWLSPLPSVTTCRGAGRIAVVFLSDSASQTTGRSSDLAVGSSLLFPHIIKRVHSIVPAPREAEPFYSVWVI